jgi:hypothetical protein
MKWFALLVTLAALAIPIAIVAKIVRRVREVTSRLRDPTHLQRVFAQSTAAALRRAGTDPLAVAARVEAPGAGGAGDRRAADLRAVLEEARAALPAPARPIEAYEAERPLHRPPRPRHDPVTPLGGFEAGDRFRLSEPPELSEPHGPASLSGSWLALVALLGAAAYFFLR